MAEYSTFDAWINELEHLYGRRFEVEVERESFREIFEAGEEPQTVIDESGSAAAHVH